MYVLIKIPERAVLQMRYHYTLRVNLNMETAMFDNERGNYKFESSKTFITSIRL